MTSPAALPIAFPVTEALPGAIVEAMLAHSRACSPNEACGLLAHDEEGVWRMAYPLTNQADSPERFTVDPTEQYGAYLHAERQGWQIGGIFHSHPAGGAAMSDTDRAQPHDPRWLHVVIGMRPVIDVGMWRLRSDVTRSRTPAASARTKDRRRRGQCR